jgi:hypothetical protein
MTVAAPAKRLPAPSRQPLHRRPIIHRRSIVTRARVCLRLIAQFCAMRRTPGVPRPSLAHARDRGGCSSAKIRRWKAIEPLMASRMLLLRRESQSVAASRSIPVPLHSGGTCPRDGVGSGDATDESARRMDYADTDRPPRRTGLLRKPSERRRAPPVTSGNRLTVCMSSPPT